MAFTIVTLDWARINILLKMWVGDGYERIQPSRGFAGIKYQHTYQRGMSMVALNGTYSQ
jgi:hypothetical protein